VANPYERYLLPWIIEHACGVGPIQKKRSQLVPRAHGRARKRAAESGIDVSVLGLPAETIPLGDGEVDTVVTTFTLCTIPDPVQALAEMRRVLKPGGELLFCEHGVAPDASVRKWQRRLNPIQRRVGGGCNLDRDITGLVRRSFEISELDEGYSEGPRFAGYLFTGIAV
jgi:SAM-dependent methyltransferase